jgi:hypothetical protein
VLNNITSSSCLVTYDQPSNSFSLTNDAGTASTSLPVGSSGSLSNSQCTLRVPGSSVTGSGNTLTVSFAVTFLTSSPPGESILAKALAVSGASSQWENLGTWNSPVPGQPPAVMTPGSGSGKSQTFTVYYLVQSGAYVQDAFLLFNTGVLPGSACFVGYYGANSTFLLLNDAGTLFSALPLGSSGSLSNSQCTLSLQGYSAIGSRNMLTLTFALSFKAGFPSVENVYAYVLDNLGAGSGWLTVGTWNTGY